MDSGGSVYTYKPKTTAQFTQEMFDQFKNSGLGLRDPRHFLLIEVMALQLYNLQEQLLQFQNGMGIGYGYQPVELTQDELKLVGKNPCHEIGGAPAEELTLTSLYGSSMDIMQLESKLPKASTVHDSFTFMFPPVDICIHDWKPSKVEPGKTKWCAKCGERE